jgi:hypothetical protein
MNKIKIFWYNHRILIKIKNISKKKEAIPILFLIISKCKIKYNQMIVNLKTKLNKYI